MILPAQALQTTFPLIVDPFHFRTRHNDMTFGLSSAGYDIRIAENHMIGPGEFELGSSIERFNMPLDVLGVVHDKSTWGRRGLAVQNTVIEPGWRGFLTLELSNHSNRGIWIESGDPIAQIIFHRLEQATNQPYEGKYQDQEAGPQEARRDP